MNEFEVKYEDEYGNFIWVGTDRDITFCANKNCKDMNCIRNCNRVKLCKYNSFAMFTGCEKWDDAGAEWLTSQLESWPEFVEMRDKLMTEKD